MEWRLVSSRIPAEIRSFLVKTFEIYEIRGRVGEKRGVKFEVRSKEGNHSVPHVHAAYGEYIISIRISDGKVLSGNLPRKQQKIAVDWVLENKEKLNGEWRTCVVSAISSLTKTHLNSYLSE